MKSYCIIRKQSFFLACHLDLPLCAIFSSLTERLPVVVGVVVVIVVKVTVVVVAVVVVVVVVIVVVVVVIYYCISCIIYCNHVSYIIHEHIILYHI